MHQKQRIIQLVYFKGEKMNILIRLLKLLVSKKYRIKIKKLIFSDKKIIEASGLKYIDKSKIEQKINNMVNVSGIFERKRTPKLIVSLTSYPNRMGDLKYTLYSLLNQSIKPDEIMLWLSYEEFPDKENSIGDDILNFKKNGLTIKFCHNLKSYKKLIPSLRKYKDCIIVTADDDIYYERDWLEKLYVAYQENPKYIHCHRAHKILLDKNRRIKPYNSWKSEISWNQTKPSFLNFFTGAGGVLYHPYSLHEDIFNEELFLKLTPTADDIWFWAMAVLQGTKISIVKENMYLIFINPENELGLTTEDTLTKINVLQGKNDEQLKAVVEHYNLYDKLFNENKE
jgi:hypothetical protein